MTTGSITTPNCYPGHSNTDDIQVRVSGNFSKTNVADSTFSAVTGVASGVYINIESETWEYVNDPDFRANGYPLPSVVMIKGNDYAVTGTDNFVKTSNLSSMLLANGIDHSIAGNGYQLLFNATQASVLTDYAHAWLNNDSYVRIGGNPTRDYGFIDGSASKVYNSNWPTGSGISALNIASARKAFISIANINTAIGTLTMQCSGLVAVSNRLNHTINNLTNISTNLSAAHGGIEDAYFALETACLAKNQFFNNISNAMLAQSNVHKQLIMGLLQG